MVRYCQAVPKSLFRPSKPPFPASLAVAHVRVLLNAHGNAHTISQGFIPVRLKNALSFGFSIFHSHEDDAKPLMEIKDAEWF